MLAHHEPNMVKCKKYSSFKDINDIRRTKCISYM
jgi:hypothetical protein